MDQIADRINASSPESIASVLRGFFLPKEFGNGFRLASEGAGMKTACANMSLSYDTGDWDQATAPGLLEEDELICCLMGNPLRSYIQYDPNPNATEFSYEVQNVDGTTTWPLTQAAAVGGTAVTTELIPRWAVATSSYQPHGPILFPGFDNGGHYYLWCDSGSNSPPDLAADARGLVVTLTTAPVAAVAGYIDWWIWTGKYPARYQRQTITTGRTVYSAAPPATGAYMFVTIQLREDLTPLTQSATLTLACNGPVWGHHCVSDITTLLTSAYGIRVNSASLRVQNDASPLYRDGKIVSVTIPANSSWISIASQGVDFLSTLSEYRERTADRGYYGVLLPDSDADVSEFYDDISASAFADSPTLNQAAFPLVERRPYKIVGIRVVQANGRSLTFDVTHTIEYLTNNKLVAQAVSNHSEQDLTAAIVIASTMETDYDNPVHWRDILSTIATYLPLGTKALMTALQLFGYNNVADQIQQRQPLVERLSDDMQAISAASARNKRGLER
jgi:hypothetical protein